MRVEPNFRWGGEEDHRALGQVMYDAVRLGDSRYTEQQRAAWAPAPRDGEAWAARLRAQQVIVAESEGAIIGFMSLAEGGYIDFAYIRPQAQGTGLFRQLFARIVDRARADAEPRLWVHASLMAEPAFRAVGFSVREREIVAIGQQRLERAVMEMPISNS
jgi:putative acetyltransferase